MKLPKFKIHDMRLLCAAIGRGEVPTEIVKPNQSNLRKFVKGV